MQKQLHCSFIKNRILDKFCKFSIVTLKSWSRTSLPSSTSPSRMKFASERVKSIRDSNCEKSEKVELIGTREFPDSSSWVHESSFTRYSTRLGAKLGNNLKIFAHVETLLKGEDVSRETGKTQAREAPHLKELNEIISLFNNHHNINSNLKDDKYSVNEHL